MARKRAIHHSSWKRDVSIALTPILAGFGLAWAVHKAEHDRPASVTNITHAGPKL